MLRAVVIIDYQNMHTTGVSRFKSEARQSKISLNPVKFSETLIDFRNSKVPDNALKAELSKVEVYRGLPSSIHDSRDHVTNIEQMNEWMRDSRVFVTHRNLKYDLTPSWFPDGTPRRYNSKTEKGIDVLCALAIMRNTKSSDIDLVIVASHDSDLEPAIEEAHSLAVGAKLETASWFNPDNKSGRAKMNPNTSPRIWNNALGHEIFKASMD